MTDVDCKAAGNRVFNLRHTVCLTYVENSWIKYGNINGLIRYIYIQGKYMHYVVVSPSLLQITEISTANAMTKNSEI